MRKLSNKAVEEIYMSTEPQKKLAKKYGVSIPTISSIIKGKLHRNETWKLKQPARKKYQRDPKLKREDIIDIYTSKKSDLEMAEKYNVHRMTINRVRNGVYYSEITDSLKRRDQRGRLHKLDIVDIYLDDRPVSLIALEYEVAHTTVRNIKKGVSHKKITEGLKEIL